MYKVKRFNEKGEQKEFSYNGKVINEDYINRKVDESMKKRKKAYEILAK